MFAFRPARGVVPSREGRPWATKVRLRENVSENEPCIINDAVGHQQVPRVFLQHFHRELKQHDRGKGGRWGQS